MSTYSALGYTWVWGVVVALASVGVLWAFPGHGLLANFALAALAAPVAAFLALVAGAWLWQVVEAVFP